MKKVMMFATVLFLGALPLSALAMSHEHGAMKSDDHAMHDSMMDQGGMIMLGDQTVEGVKGMAHLNDVQAAMAKMGMKTTHHLMVAFVGKDGKPITEGTVAVKIVSPAGKEGDPVALPGMQGHFGTDITLVEKGSYTFKVGSKLPDGVVRQYEFKYEVK